MLQSPGAATDEPTCFNYCSLCALQPMCHRARAPQQEKLRQEVDGPPQGKVIRDSFPVDWNSMGRTAGQLRSGGWALPGPHSSHSWNQKDLTDLTCAEKHLGCQRGVIMFYPDSFSVKSILANRCMYTHGRKLRYTKYGLWTRQIKMTGQRKTRIPHKSNWNCHEGVTQWLSFSPWVCPCAYLHLLYLFSLNTYFTTFHLCGNSFLQSRTLLTDHWCSG